MAWFEKELTWGVPEQELRHLSGRIGELYVAMITNGQMASSVNQRGYDVVSASGERISVKTVTSSNHVRLNVRTLSQVDRLIILRINTEEMQVEILLDTNISDALSYARGQDHKEHFIISISTLTKTIQAKDYKDIPIINSITHGGYTLNERENGSIEVFLGETSITPVKPILRQLATEANISILNSAGNPLNTRQLGSLIIKTLKFQ